MGVDRDEFAMQPVGGPCPADDVSVLQRVAFVMARGDVYLGVT